MKRAAEYYSERYRRRANDHNNGPAEPWTAPIPLTGDYDVPPFPVDALAATSAAWVQAIAEATQTPTDLAAMLQLSILAAGLARKYRVLVQEGWAEPLNLFTVVALRPGERKSTVFAEAIKPVEEYEREEAERMRPEIAKAESEHRVLEARMKHIETRAAKTEDAVERDVLKTEAKEAARELAGHVVPVAPEYICDDATPEKLGQLLAKQGGRMLQASAEGTAFEIAKGRYSETANFDVYLKGHSGDALRVGRVGRENDTVEQPALSVALAVQPDVIQGLAEHASMRGRGFLARFLYSVPRSLVGRRRVRCRPVPASVTRARHDTVLALWRLPFNHDEAGRVAPHWLQFSVEADREMEAFERWLEPQLAEGEELSYLAGWANKLAGAAARIAAVLHMAGEVSRAQHWRPEVGSDPVRRAIKIAKDYLLPHAKAAFGIMGSDARVADAKRALHWLSEHFVDSVKSVVGGPVLEISRRDLHAGVWGGNRTADQVEPVLDLLLQHGYLRATEREQRHGRGRKPSPRYEVNPLGLTAAQKRGPPPHNSRNSRFAADDAEVL